MTDNILATFELSKNFPIKGGFLRRTVAEARVLRQVSLSVPRGKIVSLVGESGCGKTTFGRVVSGLYQASSGTLLFDAPAEVQQRFEQLWQRQKDGENLAAELQRITAKYDINQLSKKELNRSCRHNQMVFQDPYGSLNPRFTVKDIVGEGLRIHQVYHSKQEELEFIQSILERTGIDPSMIHRYPHEFSGGQRQRLGIARALALQPKLMVLDEPVSALDVSVQIQIIDLFNELKDQFHLTYIFIAHDLSIVDYFTDDIAVMYMGTIVEYGSKAQVNGTPQHPYTQALISAVPTHNPARRRKRIHLTGEVPSPTSLPAGCPFHTRCPQAVAHCREEKPILRGQQKTGGHQVACWLV